MARAFLEALGLFLTPFTLFGLGLLLLGRHRREAYTRERLTLLAAAGLVLAALGFVGMGLDRDSGPGAYVPDRVENGRVIRGGAGADAPASDYRGPGVGAPGPRP